METTIKKRKYGYNEDWLKQAEKDCQTLLGWGESRI